MKRIRVTLNEEYLIPDDWEITSHPRDNLSCLHGDNAYFTPTLNWAERQPLDLPGHTTPSAQWVSVEDGRGNWFIGQMQNSEATICDIE